MLICYFLRHGPTTLKIKYVTVYHLSRCCVCVYILKHIRYIYVLNKLVKNLTLDTYNKIYKLKGKKDF